VENEQRQLAARRRKLADNPIRRTTRNEHQETNSQRRTPSRLRRTTGTVAGPAVVPQLAEVWELTSGAATVPQAS
jgi:hypothetical protein